MLELSWKVAIIMKSHGLELGFEKHGYWWIVLWGDYYCCCGMKLVSQGVEVIDLVLKNRSWSKERLVLN